MPRTARLHARLCLIRRCRAGSRIAAAAAWLLASTATAVTAAACPQGGAATPAAATPRGALVVETTSGRVAVDLATGERTPLPTKPSRGVAGPDGRVAYIEMEEGPGLNVTPVLVVRAPAGAMPPSDRPGVKDPLPLAPPGGRGAEEGTRERRIRLAPEAARELRWRGDGTGVVFVRVNHGGQEIHAVDLSQLMPKPERLSAAGEEAHMPRPGPGSQLVWAVIRQRRGKEQVEDLIYFDGVGRRTLASGVDLTEVAWRPDGVQLAYGTMGELKIVDVASGSLVRSLRLKDLDERLHAHHVEELAWSPDKETLAAVIGFSGGRASSDGTKPRLFGDREVFVIPRDGRPTVYSFDDEVTGVEWVAESALPAKRG